MYPLGTNGPYSHELRSSHVLSRCSVRGVTCDGHGVRAAIVPRRTPRYKTCDPSLLWCRVYCAASVLSWRVFVLLLARWL
eukprot:1926455-Rhodomonas_salina.3